MHFEVWGKCSLGVALRRGRAQVVFLYNTCATASHKARTHGHGWRTAHANSMDEKGHKYIPKATSTPPRAGTTGIPVIEYNLQARFFPTYQVKVFRFLPNFLHPPSHPSDTYSMSLPVFALLSCIIKYYYHLLWRAGPEHYRDPASSPQPNPMPTR